jgi:hypothetical protein
MWVRFLKSFSFKPTRATAITYQPGVYNVTKACGEKAIAKGAAEPTEGEKKKNASS